MVTSVFLPVFIFLILVGFFLCLHKLTKGDNENDMAYFDTFTAVRTDSSEELLEAEWEERKARQEEESRRNLSVAEEYI